MLIIQENLSIFSVYFSSSERFGLYHVDFNDPGRKRTAKKSAQVFSQIIKSNKIPVELLKVKNAL
jgi:beta-glucosidase/6-phospho-beta-glucosidase/beta-galactosidase